MSLGQLVVELSLDGNEFTVNLKKADGQLAQFIQKSGDADRAITRAERSTRSWGNTLRDSVIVLSLIRSAIQNVNDAMFGWQRSIIGVNAEVQRSMALMKNFSKQTDAAAASQEALADVQMLMKKASTAPFSMQAITDTFVKLRVAGIDPVQDSFNSLIDAVAAFGGTDENLKRAGVAIQQMAGKGVVSMEELRQQLGEAVPTAIQNMADGLGVTYAKLVKEISLGRVKSEPALIAMMREMELQFKGSAERMMQTWDGAVARFNTEARKLALAIGGLDEEGYAKDGYMSTLTAELNKLSDMMADPTMQAAARDFGKALAEVVSAAAEGIRWLVQYREQLGELAKALLIVYGAYKSVDLVRSITASLGATMVSVTSAIQSYTKAGMGASAALAQLNPQVATATQEWAKKGGVVGGVGKTLGVLGGVIGGLTGPIGMTVSLVGAASFAWWEHQKALDANIQSLIKMRGLQAGQMQLDQMQQRQKDNLEEIARLQGRIADRQSSSGPLANVKEFEDEIARIKKENIDMEPAIAQALANVAMEAVRVEVGAAEASLQDGLQRIQKEQAAELEGWRKRIAENEKKKDSKVAQELADEKLAIEKRRLDAEYKMREDAIARLQGEIDSGQSVTPQGNIQKLDNSQIEAKKKAVDELRIKLGELGEQQIRVMQTSKQFDDTVMEPGGGGGMDPATKFSPLAKFWQSMTVSVAKAGATAEEANPHLAQLDQILQNMADMGMKADAGLIEKARQAAVERWEQEKAVKALKTAMDSYKDSLARVEQIEKVIGAKNDKAANENPWLNAATDANRYREELQELSEALAKAREAAGNVVDGEQTVQDIDAITERMRALNVEIDKLGVQAGTKALKERTKEIQDSLKTESELVEAEYSYQVQLAQEYFEKNKTLLAQGTADRQAYDDYLAALEAKRRRDNESGLDAWIRANKDASEKYKSLWQSAMDNFVGTVTDGLIEGKIELADFVTYVLKEMLRIQMAKAAAGMLEMAGNAFMAWAGGGAGTAQNVGSSAAASGYSTTGYAGAYGFANGGIMTQWGKAKLKQYANGGIAREPQVAVFGEGSMAEAYVPLPDGRTIPVTLQGQVGGGAPSAQPAQMPTVNVNVINQSGNNVDAEQTGQSFNGEQFVVDVVLKAVNRPGPLRDAVKG
ncbi:Phage tail tape measure protein lambda [Ectopseudomonas mendocina]|uniref:Phage tail tape measure protein lambda n=1 Tax=Ectopseudomonas mendocina TaxID=300 RepID=A0A379PP00_ECTME|nr:tape measure protein [Pseudomonas mendocina]SUE95799.1 Phage tail tape measure protein lambda [Pseudomonas mendocina]